MPDFEIFAPSLPAAPKLRVTLLRRGTISINRAGYAALGSPSHVDLLFDTAASIIGIQKATQDSSNRVRPTSERGPVIVSATGFLRFHQLDVSVTTRWPAYLDGEVLCVDLTTDGVAVTSNRAGTGHSADHG